MFKDILLPTDGSRGAAEAVNCAVAIAKKFDSTIHVLFVVEPPRFQDIGATAAMNDILRAIREAGQDIVRETVKLIQDSGVIAVEEVLREGHPAEEILNYARESGMDLIVMGTHGRRGLGRLLLGSVTEEVVRTSEIPVLTVRMSE